MATVTMIECDNPKCKSMGFPESVKPLRPPYNWYWIKGFRFGNGPEFNLMTCCINCVPNALEEAERKYSHDD